MTPIDVYAGSESLIASSDRVIGLPTKEQLDTWVQEHEKIESETEQFDQGDMIRLKDFAKGVYWYHRDLIAYSVDNHPRYFSQI